MKKFLSFLLAILFSFCLLAGCAPNSTPPESTETPVSGTDLSANQEADFSDQNILILLHPSVNFKDYSTEDFKEINCISVRELTVGPIEEGKLCRILLLKIEPPSKENVLNAIEMLNKREDIHTAEPDYIEYPSEDDSPTATPNDTYVPNTYQWAINKLWLASAWNLTTGSASVRVGVIDSGIDGTHPDLTNRIDRTLSKCFSPDFSNPLEDAAGHGTHVAGIIGAQGNNNIGISGTCWNVKIISLRVATSGGGFNVSAVIDAINYANDNNIPILNYSGGSRSQGTLYATRDVAIKNYYGLFVCAAGNDNSNNDTTPFYPASNKYANLISVGASTKQDTKRSTSNYGAQSVDLFAPGENILSCTPVAACQNGSCKASTHVSNGYHYMSGTSMATPYVAGVAALLLSKYPSMSAYQLKKEILENVTFVSDLNNLCLTDGRLNAYNALAYVSCVHSYSGFIAISPSNHKSSCQCGDFVALPHNFPQSGTNRVCIDCGYSIALNNTDPEAELQ